MDIGKWIGRPIDGLSLHERWALAGQWIAMELYSPDRLPLRIIQAAGPDVRACVGQLKQRGLDPALFEYVAMEQPYAS